VSEGILTGSKFRDKAKYTALERRGQNLARGVPTVTLVDRMFPTGRQTPEQQRAFVESKLRGRTDELANRRREQFKKLAEKYAPNTPEELSNPNRTAGLGRPVDFVKKWYGPTSNNPTDDFPAELRKATEYNEIKPRTYENLQLNPDGTTSFGIPKKKSIFDVSYKHKRKRDAEEARKPITRVLQSDAYERLFDVVPMTRGPGTVGLYSQFLRDKDKDIYYGYSRRPGGTSITCHGTMPDPYLRVPDSNINNRLDFFKEAKYYLQKLKNDPEKAVDEYIKERPYRFGPKSGMTRKQVLEHLKKDSHYKKVNYTNSLGFEESMPGREAQSPSESEADTMEHEYRHHYAHPNSKTISSIRALKPQNQKPPSPPKHFFDYGGDELTQGLGKLTAEFFQHTKKTTGKGRRIHERPEDLNRLIKGGEKEIEFLSPEGRRAVRALRDHIKAHPDKKADLMKEVRRVLPALVKNQSSKDVLKNGILRQRYA